MSGVWRSPRGSSPTASSSPLPRSCSSSDSPSSSSSCDNSASSSFSCSPSSIGGVLHNVTNATKNTSSHSADSGGVLSDARVLRGSSAGTSNMGGKHCFSTLLELLRSVGSIAPVLLSFLSLVLTLWYYTSMIRLTQQLQQANAVNTLYAEYSSNKTFEALELLEDFIDTHGAEQYPFHYLELKKRNALEGKELDRARRQLTQWFSRVQYLYEFGYLLPIHLKRFPGRQKTRYFLDLVEPLEYVSRRITGRKHAAVFDFLRQVYDLHNHRLDPLFIQRVETDIKHMKKQRTTDLCGVDGLPSQQRSSKKRHGSRCVSPKNTDRADCSTSSSTRDDQHPGTTFPMDEMSSYNDEYEVDTREKQGGIAFTSSSSLPRASDGGAISMHGKENQTPLRTRRQSSRRHQKEAEEKEKGDDDAQDAGSPTSSQNDGVKKGSIATAAIPDRNGQILETEDEDKRNMEIGSMAQEGQERDWGKRIAARKCLQLYKDKEVRYWPMIAGRKKTKLFDGSLLESAETEEGEEIEDNEEDEEDDDGDYYIEGVDEEEESDALDAETTSNTEGLQETKRHGTADDYTRYHEGHEKNRAHHGKEEINDKKDEKATAASGMALEGGEGARHGKSAAATTRDAATEHGHAEEL